MDFPNRLVNGPQCNLSISTDTAFGGMQVGLSGETAHKFGVL